MTYGKKIIFSDKKGFTLIEIMIAVAMLAVLSSIAMPQVGTIVNLYKLNGAARTVWSDLQNAKMTAVKANQDVAVSLVNTTTYSYNRPNDSQGAFVRNLANEYQGAAVGFTGGSSAGFNSRGERSVPADKNTAITVNVSLAGNTKSFTVLWTGRIGNIQ